MIRDVVVDVKAREIAPFLPLNLVDQEARKHETAFLMLWVWQRQEAWREQISIANLLRCHTGEAVPRRSRDELDSDAFLHRLCTVHRDAGGRAVGQIVSFIDNGHVLPLNRRFLRRQPRQDRRERLGDLDRQVARLAARPLLRVGGAQSYDHGGSCRSGQKFSDFRQDHGSLVDGTVQRAPSDARAGKL